MMTTRRVVQNDAYIGAVARMIRSAGKRVGGDDPEQLSQLVELHQVLDEAIRVAVAGQRSQGVTWRWIGEATGTSKEAAVQKWARYCAKPEV